MADRWVVIGAGGFIGTNLCRRLVMEGHDVVAFGRKANFPEVLEGCRWIEGNFLNQADLEVAIENAEFVVHSLSTVTPATSNESPILDVEENLIGTLRLIELCSKKNVQKLIVLSSGGTVYGNNVPVPTPEDARNEPICSYGIVKLTIEKYLALHRLQSNLDSVVLRVANPFGAYQLVRGQGVVAAMIDSVLKNKPVEIWGDGSVIRDYIYIEDLIDAILAAAKITNSNIPRIYNIGSSVGRSLNEVIASITKIHGSFEVTRLSGRIVDTPVSILDISRAKKFLNWHPKIEWASALDLTYSWFEQKINADSSIVIKKN